MKGLTDFGNAIKEIMVAAPELNIEGARQIIHLLNDFLYTTHNGIGTIETLDETFEYFSDFHKFWHNNYKEILDCKVNENACEKVADALHSIYTLTNGTAFSVVWDTCGLSDEDICRIRLLTSNQDFRVSLDFKKISNIFINDKSTFNEDVIIDNPALFLTSLGLNNLSQTDKRVKYAKGIATFIKKRNCKPIEIINYFGNDVSELRRALVESKIGFGYKKADMFIRDMVVLKIWPNIKGFDTIDVASDVNTIKVALRTGLLTTAIPLVSSFIDIFCYQYEYIDKMNALAWRKVWECWCKLFPNEKIESPSLLDYFVYQVIGKQFCGDKLVVFECDEFKHQFKWHSGKNKRCQICHEEGRFNKKAHIISKIRPCMDNDGYIAILNSEFVRKLGNNKKIRICPFSSICLENKYLQPPKSISIKGKTGWETAYSIQGEGGGGLMA